MGEAGKRALEAERAARRDAEKAAKEAREELETIRKANQTEAEKALELAREEGRREGSAKVLPQLFATEVKALATGKLQDPDILGNGPAALAHLNLTEIPLRADGSIDSTAVSSALDELLVRKPSWAAVTSPGDGDQGPAGGGGENSKDLGDLSMEEYRAARAAERSA